MVAPVGHGEIPHVLFFGAGNVFSTPGSSKSAQSSRSPGGVTNEGIEDGHGESAWCHCSTFVAPTQLCETGKKMTLTLVSIEILVDGFNMF
jgi:hypothetical protein